MNLANTGQKLRRVIFLKRRVQKTIDHRGRGWRGNGDDERYKQFLPDIHTDVTDQHTRFGNDPSDGVQGVLGFDGREEVIGCGVRITLD